MNWLEAMAAVEHPSAQVIDLDISDQQFPPACTLPKNLSLDIFHHLATCRNGNACWSAMDEILGSKNTLSQLFRLVNISICQLLSSLSCN